MDSDRLIVRLAALENLTVAALALYLANSRNDPDLSKAQALLGVLEQIGHDGIPNVQELARQEGKAYLSGLLNQVLQMLPALRGDDTGRSH